MYTFVYLNHLPLLWYSGRVYTEITDKANLAAHRYKPIIAWWLQESKSGKLSVLVDLQDLPLFIIIVPANEINSAL